MHFQFHAIVAAELFTRARINTILKHSLVPLQFSLGSEIASIFSRAKLLTYSKHCSQKKKKLIQKFAYKSRKGAGAGLVESASELDQDQVFVCQNEEP